MTDAHDLPAMELLAHQMLSGRGAQLDPISGARLVMQAAERGGGFACAMAAGLLAAGLSGRPEWTQALDFLRKSAELGFAPAQDQLRLLAGRDGDNWRVLRREIDIKAWREAPRPRVLSQAPRVRVHEGLASPAVCHWIVARTRDRLKPAMIHGAQSTSDLRSNSAADMTLGDIDLVTLAVRERLAAAAGLPVMNMETPQVLHYTVGQTFRPHADFFDPAVPAQAAEVQARGQRAATALVYLNDEGLEGGETDFPNLGLRYRGRAGDALVFFNVDTAGHVDRRTIHAGLPPTKGEKWLFSQWIRDRAREGAGDARLLAALKGR